MGKIKICVENGRVHSPTSTIASWERRTLWQSCERSTNILFFLYVHFSFETFCPVLVSSGTFVSLPSSHGL